MPLVTVTWYPGRSQVAKELVARGVADALAAATGCGLDTVQVIFEEVALDSWAIGPGIAPAAAPPAARAAAPPVHVVLERIVCRAGRAEEFVAWCRDRRCRRLAVAPGLLGVSACVLGDGDYLFETRWRSAADAAAHDGDERIRALEQEAAGLLERRSIEHAGPRLDLMAAPSPAPQASSSG